jgi:tripartite ATP-independent transporter DctP family solute receptor
MRIGHPMAPGNNVTLGYEKFKELVEAKSGGKVVIKLYPDAFLGNDLVTMRAAQSGELEMASSSTPNMEGISKKFIAFDLPYITRPEKQEQLYKALDSGELGRYLERISAEVGLKPVMWSEYGYRNFATVRRELKTPGDMAGLRLRTTQSPIDIEVVKALGATPVSLIWADTYPALLRGSIDGEGNTFSLLYSSKHHEVLRHITVTRHNYSMHVLMMNLAYWNRLPREIQNLISEAAREALSYERSITKKLEQEAAQSMQAQGLKVVELTPPQLAEWQNAAKPVWNKFRTELPPELVKLIQDTQQ